MEHNPKTVTNAAFEIFADICDLQARQLLQPCMKVANLEVPTASKAQV